MKGKCFLLLSIVLVAEILMMGILVCRGSATAAVPKNEDQSRSAAEKTVVSVNTEVRVGAPFVVFVPYDFRARAAMNAFYRVLSREEQQAAALDPLVREISNCQALEDLGQTPIPHMSRRDSCPLLDAK
jgi:hypothetical protein